MPNSYIDNYFPVLVQLHLAAVIAAALVALALLLGKRLKNKVKDVPYECGITPVGSAKERFSVKFYLVAMLFILFDIEAIFLYPWAVVYRELRPDAFRLFGFVEMLIFIALVLSGFFYIYKKGVLNWGAEPASAAQPAGSQTEKHAA